MSTGAPERPGLPEPPDPTAGSIAVLTAGLVAVLLGLIAVVADASSVFLARREVAAACDAAASTAAQAVDRTVLYGGSGAGERLPLSLPDARSRVAGWLVAQGESGLRVVVIGLADDGTSVLLACSRPERPRLRGVVGLPAVTVVAHARARSPLTS